MNIFLALFIIYIQAHPFDQVKSGVQGMVVETPAPITQDEPVIVPEPTPEPQPVPEKPVVRKINTPEPTVDNPKPKPTIDPYCGIPWPDKKELYKQCMESQEHTDYMSNLK